MPANSLHYSPTYTTNSDSRVRKIDFNRILRKYQKASSRYSITNRSSDSDLNVEIQDLANTGINEQRRQEIVARIPSEEDLRLIAVDFGQQWREDEGW